MHNVEYFSTLARYNQWMNERIYGVCATMSEEERKRDLSAFFRSIHGTLNHLLYGDMAWMGRFQDRPEDMPCLGQELYEDFAMLADRRTEMDTKILRWTKSLDADWLQEPLSFRSNVDGITRTRPAWLLVAHMFNHQTHHRGQVTTLMMQLGRDPGVTDLPWMSWAD